MAGRSFFRRLLGSRSDAVGPDDVSAAQLHDGFGQAERIGQTPVLTAPSPGGPVPVPHPFGDGPTPVEEPTSRDVLPDGTSPSDVGGRQVAADAEPTAFDEADAVFGTRTGVADAQEAAPPAESTPQAGAAGGIRNDSISTDEIVSPNNVVDGPDDGARPLTSDDGIVGPNGIISPNNVVESPANVADPIDGVVVRDPDGNVVAMAKEETIDAAPDKGDISKGDVSNSDLDEETVGENGIVSPNNIVADADDDLVLADLSGGSIGDQLAANAGVSSDATEFDLTDDFEDFDDLDDVD